MYTLGQSSLTLTTDSNCKHSLETIKLETQASPIIFSEELKTMCKHQQDWQDSKPISLLSCPKIENHVLPKTEVEHVPLHSLVALVKIESAESQIVTTNLVPSVKEEGIGPIDKFKDQSSTDNHDVQQLGTTAAAFASLEDGRSPERVQQQRRSSGSDSRVCDEKCTNGNNPNLSSKMCGAGGVELNDYTSTNSTIRNIPKGHEKTLFNKQNHFSCDTCGGGQLNVHTGKTFPINIKKCNEKRLNENHFSCDICGMDVTTKRSIRDHLHSHFPTNEFGCDICGKFLPSERLLKQHKSIHSGRRYECKICLKNYTSKYSLSKHKRLHQPGGLPKEHLCEICGCHFVYKDDLKSHISSVHFHEKRYICDICGGGYRNSHKFTSHMATHSEDKRFICGVCDRCFKRRDDIKHHITRVHPKTMGLQKPKKHCSLCEKVYTTKEGLTKHMVRHSGERKFVCDLCGKRFMHLFDLSKHKKSSIHNGK